MGVVRALDVKRADCANIPVSHPPSRSRDFAEAYFSIPVMKYSEGEQRKSEWRSCR